MAKTKLSQKDVDFYLVQRALCGDQEAYTTIFSKYLPVLTNQVKKYIKDPHQQEDIVMETFQRAFDRLQNFQPDYQLSAWLVRIGVNLSIDCVRKQKRYPHISIDNPYGDDEDYPSTLQIWDSGHTPAERLTHNQRLDYLRTVLGQINPQARKAIQLRYFDDLPLEEIAEMMELNVQQTKNLLHRAKKELVRKVGSVSNI